MSFTGFRHNHPYTLAHEPADARQAGAWECDYLSFKQIGRRSEQSYRCLTGTRIGPVGQVHLGLCIGNYWRVARYQSIVSLSPLSNEVCALKPKRSLARETSKQRLG